MALPLGIENKRQVFLLAALVAVILVAGGYEIYNQLSGPPPLSIPTAVQAPALRTPPGQGAATSGGTEAQKLNIADINPALHLDKLAASEDVAYAGTGRNIFSTNSAPPIPKPIAPPRPAEQAANTPPPPPPPPQPPAIDLKYFGYSQDTDRSYKAFFLHGEDIFMAHAGEIVDHRYKVGAISRMSVEITDLAYNNTQTILLSPN